MQDTSTKVEKISETTASFKESVGETITDYLKNLDQNVSDNERIVSAVAGGGLVAYGISKGGLFGTALSLVGGGLLLRGATGHCQVYGAMDKSTAAPKDTKIHVQKSVTINKSQAELYQFWRNFENLPQFMNHLESVETTGETTSHWKAKAPLGMTVEWDAEITSDIPNERIGWKSAEIAEVRNSGTVEFRPTANRGTEVRVTLTYEPPAGKVGALIAKLFGEEPSQQISEDLRRFKSLMETGLIMNVEGQTSGRIAEIAEERNKFKTAAA